MLRDAGGGRRPTAVPSRKHGSTRAPPLIVTTNLACGALLVSAIQASSDEPSATAKLRRLEGSNEALSAPSHSAIARGAANNRQLTVVSPSDTPIAYKAI